jgi:hypothetical protein
MSAIRFFPLFPIRAKQRTDLLDLTQTLAETLGDRVTRLDEFSPFGRLFTLGNLFEIVKSSQNCGLLFNKVKFMHYFFTKRSGLHFGPFFLVTLLGGVC